MARVVTFGGIMIHLNPEGYLCPEISLAGWPPFHRQKWPGDHRLREV